ncbi:hypothetical protein ID062_19065 [Vibrio cholerae]|uniref:hypothetical protein n=1 Tax=Vibrio cholerae TaxID=666 RepID=UPI0004E43EBD|nr:hypothetical protein [Vibrio cholerae]EGQ9844483.1 hypothetical protein [Vibrio cholerae]EGR1041905.1 hypothetical protein [Vibrio cholerae]EGR1089421.1 hypothetical protein [Vibrio cholerae]KFE23324.1 hypothetical protein DA89_1998 [Vibrio cholerae]BCK29780.1 hypothetical protein VCSRO77_3195 [Vibrio cholerae]
MFGEIKEIVRGSGLFKAIEQVELEISTGKFVEKKVDTTLIEKTESNNLDLIAKGQRTQFKKGQQASFASYEDYTEEEQFELVEKALICGIADAVSTVQTLRDFCADFDVTIQFDDEKLIEAREVDDSFLEIEKEILTEVARYE